MVYDEILNRDERQEHDEADDVVPSYDELAE